MSSLPFVPHRLFPPRRLLAAVGLATAAVAFGLPSLPSPIGHFEDVRAARLAAAAISGKTREIDQLIHDGVNPNTLSREGAPILVWAYLAGSRPGYQELLDQHADPGIHINHHGLPRTFPHLVILTRPGETFWFEQLLRHGLSADWGFDPPFDKPLIYDVIDCRRNDLLAVLIAHGANVNRQLDKWAGTPPLLNTVSAGYNLPAALLLLQAGADYTSHDEFEKGFLDYLDEVGARAESAPSGPLKPQYESLVQWLSAHGAKRPAKGPLPARFSQQNWMLFRTAVHLNRTQAVAIAQSALTARGTKTADLEVPYFRIASAAGHLVWQFLYSPKPGIEYFPTGGLEVQIDDESKNAIVTDLVGLPWKPKAGP